MCNFKYKSNQALYSKLNMSLTGLRLKNVDYVLKIRTVSFFKNNKSFIE